MRNTLGIVLAVVAVAAIAYYYTNQNGGPPPLLAAVTYTGDTDGVAVVDFNPDSPTFGQILQRQEMGVGVTPHHLYFNRDGSKFYTTALGGEMLYRIALDGERIGTITALDAGACQMGEDLFFTDDGQTYYLTCMGSDEILVFDARTDQMRERIASTAEGAFVRYPHGLWLSPGIDRMLVTETVSADLSQAGSTISEIELSTGQVLASHTLAKPEGAPSAPVEVFFLPDRPLAYVTGMLDASLWTARWDAGTESFDFKLVDDGGPRGHSWPLEMYLGPQGNLYVSWAQPGAVDEYSLQNPEQPRYLRTLPAAAGAHHILFGADGKTMYVQNNLLGLEAMNAGTITLVDLDSGKEIATVTSFLDAGLLPTSMVFLKKR